MHSLTSIAALLCLLAPLPAMAQSGTAAPAETATPAPTTPARSYKTIPVLFKTTAGDITIALEIERAPITAGNFLRYVDQKRFDGTTFYRALLFPTAPDYGLIQGGTKNDPKRVLKPIPLEPTSKTGLTHDDGAVSMARGAPNSADGDFFVILGGLPPLDAINSQDGLGYAVFGHVTAGMDVVRAIAVMERNPAAGPPAMRGQILAEPVKILSARRVTAP